MFVEDDDDYREAVSNELADHGFDVTTFSDGNALLCAFGDGAISPVVSSIKYFRDEFIEHFKHGGCPFDPAASTLFALESAR